MRGCGYKMEWPSALDKPVGGTIRLTHTKGPVVFSFLCAKLSAKEQLDDN